MWVQQTSQASCCGMYTPHVLKLDKIKTKKSHGPWSIQSIDYQQTLHWMTSMYLKFNQTCKSYSNWTLNLWPSKHFSFSHRRITHKTAVPICPKLACCVFWPKLFFCCSICNMHSHDGWLERFHKSQVVQKPRKRGHCHFGSLGGSFQVVTSRNCWRVWENSHCSPICSVFSMLVTLQCHVSQSNNQFNSSKVMSSLGSSSIWRGHKTTWNGGDPNQAPPG